MTKSHKPIHIGIIPDGSRRWGRRQGKPSSWDGWESGEKVHEILSHVRENYPDVTEITIWAMSVENFERTPQDKQRVFGLIERLIAENGDGSRVDEKLAVVGSKFDELPASLKQAIEETTERTKGCHRRLNVGLGYGGKQEILVAAAKLAERMQREGGRNFVTARHFEKCLMVAHPIDLVIRTGGEKRLSGFFPYQAGYAELFFLDTLWPDFSVKQFDDVMREFQQRDRRFGR